MEPPPVLSLPEAWAAALATLPAIQRETVSETAAFVAFEKGILKLAVRQELWRGKVRDRLRDVDLGAFFPGFRNVEVVLEGDVGQTGREARHEADGRRRADARVAAEGSPALQRILSMFGGQLEGVEPSEKEVVTSAGEEPGDE